MDKNEYIDLFHKLQLNEVAFKPLFRCDDEVLALVNAALAQRTWVGLTDDEMKQCSYGVGGFMIGREEAMRAVQAKLKEKNNGG